MKRKEMSGAGISEILEQGKWWRTGAGDVVRIRDMTQAHRLSTLAYLERWVLRNEQQRGAGIQPRWSGWHEDGDWPWVTTDAEVRDVAWLRSRPLYQVMLRHCAVQEAEDVAGFQSADYTLRWIHHTARDALREGDLREALRKIMEAVKRHDMASD